MDREHAEEKTKERERVDKLERERIQSEREALRQKRERGEGVATRSRRSPRSERETEEREEKRDSVSATRLDYARA